MEKPKFKVGDKVRLIGDGITLSASCNRGYEGLVTEVSKRFGEWFSDGRDGMSYYYFVGNRGVHEWEKGLELVRSAVDESAFSSDAAHFDYHEDYVGTFSTKDSGTRKDFASGMSRDGDDDKPRYDLIPPQILKRLAELYARGAKKYGDNNWRLANTEEEYERFKASANRHFIQWAAGWDTEEDHAVATIWNIAAYEWHTRHKGVDDKKKYVATEPKRGN